MRGLADRKPPHAPGRWRCFRLSHIPWNLWAMGGTPIKPGSKSCATIMPFLNARLFECLAFGGFCSAVYLSTFGRTLAEQFQLDKLLKNLTHLTDIDIVLVPPMGYAFGGILRVGISMHVVHGLSGHVFKPSSFHQYYLGGCFIASFSRMY